MYSDYASRNPVECNKQECQVCQFVVNTAESVVRACTVKDVLDSTTPVPFSSRSGWYELQLSDSALRRTSAHLKQGTKPSRKTTGMRDVKRYLPLAKVARDGLIVVPHHSPTAGKTDKIVVPRKYLHGLLECLHLKLHHPSKLQLRQVFVRAYFALDLDDALNSVSKRCHTCVSLADMPNRFLHQETTTKPSSIGSNYSADIIRRDNQAIMIIREYVSAFTAAKLVHDEQATTMRTALLVLCSELIPQSGPVSTVKVDPASACRKLVGDKELRSNGIILELGEPKYKNKNPVAERAVREMHSELNRVLDGSTIISERNLSRAVANMNGRIRGEGLSSREIWTQRSQFSGEQLPVNDYKLMKSQVVRKQKSHIPSATYKSRGKGPTGYSQLCSGDIVYVNSDRDKTRPRERYIVREVYKETCKVQKFAGRQLRARPYKVNRADITIIEPWEFEVDESDDEGIIMRKGDNTHERDLTANDDENPAEIVTDDENLLETTEIEYQSEESQSDEEVTVTESPQEITRSGRQVRRPAWQKDFVVRKE